jgi:IS4 transposase
MIEYFYSSNTKAVYKQQEDGFWKFRGDGWFHFGKMIKVKNTWGYQQGTLKEISKERAFIYILGENEKG